MEKQDKKEYCETISLKICAASKRKLIGIKISIKRESLGLTQQELAIRMERQASQISRAEREGIKDVDFIRELEQALGVEKGWLE